MESRFDFDLLSENEVGCELSGPHGSRPAQAAGSKKRRGARLVVGTRGSAEAERRPLHQLRVDLYRSSSHAEESDEFGAE